MQSQASAVETYIDEAPADRRAGLRLLRKLCRDALDGFEEELRFGMPSYVRDGAVEIAFASQKRYISFYVLRRAALELQADRLRSLSVGEGCVRFRRLDEIDPDVMRALLAATVERTGPLC